MCGISAIIRFAGNAGADLADLATMHDLLLHRGPDAEGAFVVDERFRGRRLMAIPHGSQDGPALKLVSAVRRLRVSDLREEADQPLVSADGSLCVLLNGAIYNYRELAAELAKSAGPLRTGSDAEVVLEAYRRWGAACFGKFVGMWAILIVDVGRRKVVGSRDRLGIKPLYHAIEGQRVVFCSEPAAMARVLDGGAAPEPARFFEFMSGHPPRSTELSFFRGVHPVPPASYFELDLQSDRVAAPTFHPYWNLADHHWDGAPPAIAFAEAVERYRDLLESAVASQSLADVKVGSLLSGGLDTSTIVSLWARAAAARRSAPAETFSITWDDPRMDERAYQQAVVAQAGARSHARQLTAADVWTAVDTVVSAQGQPLLGQELIAQNFAYQLAHREGAVVVLDGSGSDEVQAGLPPYEAEMVLERVGKLQFWDVARELHCIARNYGRPYRSVVRQYLIAPLRRHLRRGGALPHYDWLDQDRCSDPQWPRAFTADEGRDPSRLNRLLYRETRHTNIPAVLMYSDRNAMAHSVEARFPFLDHRLVEFCFSLPPAYKVGFGARKRLLLETTRDLLPALVRERKDKRYFVRQSNWMPLRDHAATIRDAARSESFRGIAWIDAPRMHAFVEEYLAGKHDNAYAVWRIYTASRWLALHGM